MKNYVLLGILLLAGVSFAADGCSWAAYAAKGYGCSMYQLYGYAPDAMDYTYWDIAADYFDNDNCFDYESMGSAWEDMAGGLWGDGPGQGMCYNAGCYDGCELESLTWFRSGITQYNAGAFAFKRLFLAGMRECLTNPEYEGDYSSSEVMQMLQYGKANYRECVALAGPCWGCST